MRTDYVVFWADDHHPVRILPIRMRELDHELGSYAAVKMNAYCKHLESLGLGQRILWEATDDRRGSYPELLARDLAEYDNWYEARMADD
jgi:hypothetical protein